MKLKDLKSILFSRRGNIQFAIVYDLSKNADVENGCSIEYAVKEYGEREVTHIEAFENQLLITVQGVDETREVEEMSAMNYIMEVEITRGTAPEGLPSEIRFKLYCEFFCNESDYGNGYHVSIEGKGFNDLYYDIRYDRDFDPKNKAEWLEQWARNFWHGRNGAWAVKDLKVTEVQD